MKEILLTQGKVALVDDEDFEALNKFKWLATSEGYAARCVTIAPKKRITVLMHRVIIGDVAKGMHTDHKDHNGFNNQKANLRVCTCSQNQMNKRKIRGLSKFKGVSVLTAQGGRYKYYISQLKLNKVWLSKHYFPYTPEGEIAAANWYNEQAIKHHGEFAHLNKI